MKNLSVLFTLVTLTAFGTTAIAKTQYKVFRPEGAGASQFLQSKGKKYRYFELEQGKSIEFSVAGPTKVKVRNRPALEGGVKSVNFEIQIWEGEELVTGRKAKSNKSDLKGDVKGVDIGLARDIFFRVPKGRHKYQIKFVSAELKKSYVRFYQEKKKSKPKYSPYKPSKFGDTIRLKGEKSNVTYYLVDKNGGVELSVIGPAEVMIYCRTNFDKTVTGKSKYALGIFENGTSIKKFSGIARKSTKMVYSDRTDLIPAVLKKYTLDIPPGKHTYTFKKVNSAAPSLSIRFK